MKKLPDTAVKAAVIGAIIAGIFVVVGACATGFIPLIPHSSRVVIVDFGQVLVGRQPAFEVLLKNPSDKNALVTSVTLHFWQHTLYNVLGSSIYTLKATARACTTSAESCIKGNVTKEGQNISYPLSGEWSRHVDGGWDLSLTLPVREEIVANDSQQILILLPEVAAVEQGKHTQALSLPWSSSANPWRGGDSPKQISFAEFFHAAGAMNARIDIVYDQGKKSSLQKFLNETQTH